jgi:hypothetical protein
MAIRSLKSGTFSRSGMVGNPVIMPGSYESIATVTVGAGGSSSISFTGIPSTYQHLQLRMITQQNASLNDYGNINLSVNSDSGSNYAWHFLYGYGTGVGAEGYSSRTNGKLPVSYLTSGSIFSASICDILDYSNTNKHKTIRTLGGNDANGSANFIAMYSNLWMSTSAITSLTLTGHNGNFTQYSSFALYGVN